MSNPNDLIYALNRIIIEPGSLGIGWVKDEGKVRVVITGAGPSNVVRFRARIINQQTWVTIVDFTGNVNELIDIYTYDQLEAVCTVFDPLNGYDFRIMASSFNGSNLTIATGDGTIESASTLNFTSSDDSILISADANTGTVDFTTDVVGGVSSVNGRTGDVILYKYDVGLSQVDNTSDADKPISSATQTALNGKQNSLGFTPENVANKATNLTSPDNTKYPTTQAVATGLSGKADTVHNHDLSALNQSSASNGQVPTWNGTNWVPATPSAGVTDHGALTGLADDDHTQYHNDARGDARYYTKTQIDSTLDANTYYHELHVNFDYTGGSSDGSPYKPFTTIQSAVNAAQLQNVGGNTAILIHLKKDITMTENVVVNNAVSNLYITAAVPSNTDACPIKIVGSLTITGSQTNRVRVKDIQFAPNSGYALIIDGSNGRHMFQNCQFTNGSLYGQAGTGVNFTGIYKNFTEFVDCTIEGVVNIAGTPSALTTIAMYRCRLGYATVIANAANVSIGMYDTYGIYGITHSAGSLAITGMWGFSPSGFFNSTAAFAATSFLSLANMSMQRYDLSYVTLNKTGTCYFQLINVHRGEVSDVLTGTRFVYGPTSTDSGYKMGVSGNWSPAVSNVAGALDQLAANKISTSQKGVANGVAPLNSSTKIDSTYLPAYVDDVLEFANLAAFPVTGTAGIIYIAIDTNLCYRWSGSTYIEISSSSDRALTTLSNLGTTAINSDLVFSRGAGVSSTINSKALVSGEASGALTVTSGDVSAGSALTSGALNLKSGSVSGSGTGNSGISQVVSGDVSNGTSGESKLLSGAATGTGLSGNVTVATGATVSSKTGDISVTSGAATSAASGLLALATGAVVGGSGLTSGNISAITGSVSGAITTNGNSGSLTFRTGTVNAGTSGAVSITSGTGTTATTSTTNTGSVTVRSGSQSGLGSSGSFSSGSGTASTGSSGSVTVSSGAITFGSTNSGTVSLSSGTVFNGTSGSLTLNSGSSSTSGGSGSVSIASGNTGTAGTFDGAVSGAMSLKSGNVVTGINRSGSVTVESGTTVSGVSGDNTFGSGNSTLSGSGSTYLKSGNATTGTSGNVYIQTGTGVTRGKVSIDAIKTEINSSLDMLTHKINNVVDPTSNQDAATKYYVDNAITSVTVPDATTLIKGKLKLAGDLAGTADLPTVPGLANKEPTITAGTNYQYWRGDKSWQTLNLSAIDQSSATTGQVPIWNGSTWAAGVPAGTASWGGITGTLSSQTDLQTALNGKFNNPTGDTTQYIAGDGTLITFPSTGAADRLQTTVYNETGATIPKMSVIYLDGPHGNLPKIVLAIADNEVDSALTYGIIQNDINDMSSGICIEAGRLENLNTNIAGWSEGDVLYLSPTVLGGITNIKPIAPNQLVIVGVLVRKHPAQGVIQVKIQNGYEINELHNVLINGSLAANQTLKYDSVTSLWKNQYIGLASDIEQLSFSITNNQSSAANITGLSFANATVRGFNVIATVQIDATGDLFEEFVLNGVQGGSSWSMSVESVGDDSGIVLSITSAGQIQYTSSNYTGFVSGIIKFRAITTSI